MNFLRKLLFWIYPHAALNAILEVIRPINLGTQTIDFELAPDTQRIWIDVPSDKPNECKLTVCIVKTDEGVVVDIYRDPTADEEATASTYEFFPSIEEQLKCNPTT